MAEQESRPSAEEIVLYEKDPKTKIATITLDRADELNAMTIDAQHRYADLIHYASIDDDVKVLVIRARWVGGSHCDELEPTTVFPSSAAP